MTENKILTSLFSASFVFYYLSIFVKSTNLSYLSMFSSGSFAKILVILSVGLLLLKVMLANTYSVKHVVTIVIGVMVGAIIAFKSGQHSFFYIVMFTLFSDRIDIYYFLKTFIWISATSLFILLVMSKFGIIYDFEYFRTDWASGLIKSRYSLGDLYPTSFSSRLTFLIAAVVFVKRFDLNYMVSVLLSALVIYVYLETDSRVDLVVGLLLIVIGTFGAQLEKTRLLNNRFWGLIPFIIATIMLILVLMYQKNPGPLLKLDSILSSRIAWSAIGFNRYNFHTLFGQKVIMSGAGGLENSSNYGTGQNNDYFFIDSSYMNILLNYGVLFAYGVYCVYFVAANKFREVYKNNDFGILIMILSIQWLINQYIVETGMQPFFIVAVSVLMSKFYEGRRNEII